MAMRLCTAAQMMSKTNYRSDLLKFLWIYAAHTAMH